MQLSAQTVANGRVETEPGHTEGTFTHHEEPLPLSWDVDMVQIHPGLGEKLEGCTPDDRGAGTVQGQGSIYTLKARRHRASLSGSLAAGCSDYTDPACSWEMSNLTLDDSSSPATRQTSATQLGRTCSKHISPSSPGLPDWGQGSRGLMAQTATCFRRSERTSPAEQPWASLQELQGAHYWDVGCPAQSRQLGAEGSRKIIQDLS